MSSSGVWGEFAATILLGLTIGAVTYRLVVAMPRRLLDVSRLARVADWLFLVLFGTHIIVFASLLSLKHASFHTGYDFAIFDQVVWNSLRGRLLETSITGLGATWLGTHFAPILLALVPVYAVWDDPRALLVFQTLALSFTALPIYWLAKERLGGLLAIITALVFFLYPSQQHANLFEFHDIALAAPILGLAIYLLLKKHIAGGLVCLALALLVREEVAFIVAACGLVLCLFGNRRLGLAIGIVGAVWGVALVQFVIPSFAERQGNYIIGLHYSSLGTSLPEVVRTVLSKPDLLFGVLCTSAKIEFVLYLFAPLAFLPLLGWQITLASLPSFGYLLLLPGGNLALARSHHIAPMLPLLFLGLVVGAQRVLEWSRYRRFWGLGAVPERIHLLAMKCALAALLLVTGGLSYYSNGAGPGTRNFNAALYTLDNARATLIRELLNHIPNDAPVLTTGGLTPHLSHREYIYYFPFINDVRQADYVIVDLAQCAWCREDMARVPATGYFELVTQRADLFFARRKPLEHSLRIQFGDRISLIGYTIATTDTLRGGQTFQPILGWQATVPIAPNLVTQTRLTDSCGHLWAFDERGIGQRGRAGDDEFDQYALTLPSTMPPGNYELRVRVRSSDDYLVGRDTFGNALDDIRLAVVRIEKDKSSITASQLLERFQLENPYYVDIGEMRLIGFKPMPREVATEQMVSLGIYWRARGKPQGDYLVAVQLRDATGRVAFEHASRPANGAYPTTEWDAGEVLLDWHDFILPSDLAVGTYQIAVALRDADLGKTLGDVNIAPITVGR